MRANKIKSRTSTSKRRTTVKSNNKNKVNKARQRGGGEPGDFLLHVSRRDDLGSRLLTNMVFHPTQPLMAVGEDFKVSLFHIGSTPGERPFKKYIAQDVVGNTVGGLAFHQTHPLLACCWYNGVTLYRIDQYESWSREYDQNASSLAAEYDFDVQPIDMVDEAPKLPSIPIHMSNSENNEIRVVAFHPTRLFMAVSDDNTINILQISPDYSNATEIQSFKVYKRNELANPIINIAFNCDGTRLLCTFENDYYIKVFDVLPTGEVDECGLLFITRQIISLACHPINPHVVCIGSMDGNVILVTLLTSFNHTYILNKLYRSPVNYVAFHPGGDVIITGCGDGVSEMCEYDTRTNKVTTMRRLGVAPSEPVLSVSANINFIAVLRRTGIDIYSYNWSRGERIRPAIRDIATALPPPLALSQTQFGVTNFNRNQAKVQVAQNAQEYQSICLTGEDMTQDICAQAECSVCKEPIITSDNQLAEPVFFHETLKTDGTVRLAHPIHMKDLLGMYAANPATSRMACPDCRILFDITKSQLDTVSNEFNDYQERASEVTGVRKAVSKIGSVFKGHKTRKSSQGRAAVVAVARERAFQGSRKAFIQQHRKEKADAVNAIAMLTGVDAAKVNSVLENEWSRLVDYDDAIRSTTELLLAQKSQKQAQLKSEYLRSKQSK